MPTLIHRSGLCQAVSFYEANANSNTDESWAFKQFLMGFAECVLLTRPASARTVLELAIASRNATFSDYQWLSRDALQCATWFKRYADALLPRDDEDPS